jgi:glycosyltransferase involved in cell wall biosynthesis
VLYGAGRHGRLLLHHFEKNGLTVECFCDKDAEKQETGYCGKRVIPPHALTSTCAGLRIVVAVFDRQDEIRSELISLGVAGENIFCVQFELRSGFIRIPAESVSADCVAENKLETCVAKSVPKTGGERKFPFTGSAQNRTRGRGKIFVYTPVYNVPPCYLRRSIESVLGQTHANFKYLLVDNGSTDASNAIMREYAQKDARVEIVVYEENSQKLPYGVARERSKKLAENIPDEFGYCCRIDSDDYFENNFLENAYGVAQACDADIVIGGTLFYREEDPLRHGLMPAPIGTRIFNKKPDIANMIYRYGIHHGVVWGKLFRTKMFRSYMQIFKPAELRSIGDVYASCVSYTKCETIAFSDAVTHYWTRRKDSASFAIREDANFFTRWLVLHDRLLPMLHDMGPMPDEGAVSKELLLSLPLDEDVRILNDARFSHPELVTQAIESARSSRILFDLREDAKVKEITQRLRDILNDSEV